MSVQRLLLLQQMTRIVAPFSVDKMAKRIVFDNTTVVNVDSETILTMNGTIDYN